jgi:VanZ family protein
VRHRQREPVSGLESRIVAILWTLAFLALLAAFSITFLTHANTFAIFEPIIRRIAPRASNAEIAQLHIAARKLGHFLIPAIAYLILVIGQLRGRPWAALILCAVFAVLDETLQAFTPGRSGSIYDVALDVSGAVLGFIVYSLKRRRPAGKLAPRVSA